jgi:hypothetical protein
VLFVGFHVGNDISGHLADALGRLLRGWRQPAKAGILDTEADVLLVFL